MGAGAGAGPGYPPETALDPIAAQDALATEADPDRLSVYLHPGRIFTSPQPATVRMVLGSCVAVCLWDPGRRVGGANHFLLPHPIGRGGDSPRFGNVAVQRLIAELLALGCTKHSLLAKLFGGSCVLEAFQTTEAHLGTKNVGVARQLLTEEGIPIVAEDVGGQRGRRVIFHTDDGSAWVRRLQGAAQ